MLHTANHRYVVIMVTQLESAMSGIVRVFVVCLLGELRQSLPGWHDSIDAIIFLVKVWRRKE